MDSNHSDADYNSDLDYDPKLDPTGHGDGTSYDVHAWSFLYYLIFP